MNSICVKCGSEKHDYSDACGACGFEPETERELAMSLILSGLILGDGWQTGDVDLPRDDDELSTIADMLKRGEAYQFDESTIDYVVRRIRELNHLTGTRVLLVYFIPATVVIGAGMYVLVKFVSILLQ